MAKSNGRWPPTLPRSEGEALGLLLEEVGTLRRAADAVSTELAALRWSVDSLARQGEELAARVDKAVGKFEIAAIDYRRQTAELKEIVGLLAGFRARYEARSTEPAPPPEADEPVVVDD